MSGFVRKNPTQQELLDLGLRAAAVILAVSAFLFVDVVVCFFVMVFANLIGYGQDLHPLGWQGVVSTILTASAVPYLLAHYKAEHNNVIAAIINNPGHPENQRAAHTHGVTSSAPATHDAPKGNSKFATLADVQQRNIWTSAEIAAGSDRDQGQYLGRFLENGQPSGGGRATGVIRYTGPKHLITIGPPGSNKSMGLAVENIVNLRRSMVIIDTKCQLAPMTHRARKAMGEVIVINPFGLLVDKYPHLKSDGFNPLPHLNEKSLFFEADAASIASCLIPMDPNEHQKIFSQGAREILQAAIMWECRTKKDKASLFAVRNALTAPTLKDKDGYPISGFGKLLEDMAMEEGFLPIANLAAPHYEKLRDKTSGNTMINDTLTNLRTATRPLDDRPIANDLKGKAIDFGSFREKITTVYVVMPPKELTTYGVWLRLIIGSALNALYHTPLPSEDKMLPPVYFLLDEFAALGHLQEIEDALSVSRDYGVQLHVMIQYLEQVKRHYPGAWPGFFSGAGAVTAFAPGMGDEETSAYLAKLCGERTTRVQGSSVNLGQDGKVTPGQSWSDQTQPLIRSEELRRMPTGQMLCMVDPEPLPFFTSAPVYVDTPFAAEIDDNPYYRKRATS
jgi:type IV secretion system protein VirD4